MPLITLTHSMGSLGETVARRVADNLQLKIYDDAELHQMALAGGLPLSRIQDLDEKTPGLFERLISDKPRMVLEIMESVINDIARQGSGILMGHGSQVLLQNFECAFHVRIHAPRAYRIKNIATTRNFSLSAAEKLVLKNDERQQSFFRYAYGLAWDDPGIYDLIVNTGKISVDTAADLISTTARSDDITSCGMNVLQTMEMRAQEKQLYAVLLKHHIDVTQLNIEITEPGIASIVGLTTAPEDLERLHLAIKEVRGIDKISIEVSHFKEGYI